MKKMKIAVENLGNLKYGEIELNEFTVVCGENNTGKTYLTHTIYGLMKFMATDFDILGSDWKHSEVDGVFHIDLQGVKDSLPLRLEEASGAFLKKLPGILSSPIERFSGTKIAISLQPDEEFIDRELESNIRMGPNVFLSIKKEKGEPRLTVTSSRQSIDELPGVILRRILTDSILHLLFGENFFEVFIVSTERTGAVTFRNELNLTKNRLIDAAHQMDPESQRNPLKIWEALQKSAYPLPVRDNLDFSSSLQGASRHKSFIEEEYQELLKQFGDLIGGSLILDQQSSEIFFQPSSSSKSKLSVSESSSSVRSLMFLGFYLKHLAERGALLMIDEPELNLHPKNQRRFARLLAELVSAGLRVYVTTHSDYLLRELNNLILLKGRGQSGLKICEERGLSRSSLIDAATFSLYTLRNDQFRAPNEARQRKGNRVRIIREGVSQEDGVTATTFDDTIADIDEIYRQIIFSTGD